jgi:hypothetical protein
MTGALAPFGYLAVNKVLRDGPVAGLRSGEGTTFVGSTVNLEKTFFLSIISFCFDTKSAIATFEIAFAIAIAIFIYFTALRSRS